MRTRREKITGRVLALDRSLEDALPYLYGLLGLVDEKNQVAEIEAANSQTLLARCDQAHPAARERQPAAGRDISKTFTGSMTRRRHS